MEITRERDVMGVIVMGLSARRGPAPEAASLYRETHESAERRALARAAESTRPARTPAPAKRPDKKARRELQRFLRGD